MAERIFRDFYFWAAGFFCEFCRRIISPLFCGERKIPQKILQENPRQNPPKFIQQKSPTHFCRGAAPKKYRYRLFQSGRTRQVPRSCPRKCPLKWSCSFLMFCLLLRLHLGNSNLGSNPGIRIFRYRPKGVLGKGVGNNKNASEMRQKCAGLVLLAMGKRNVPKCVRNTSKMRQRCAEHLWGRTPFG